MPAREAGDGSALRKPVSQPALAWDLHNSAASLVLPIPAGPLINARPDRGSDAHQPKRSPNSLSRPRNGASYSGCSNRLGLARAILRGNVA